MHPAKRLRLSCACHRTAPTPCLARPRSDYARVHPAPRPREPREERTAGRATRRAEQADYLDALRMRAQEARVRRVGSRGYAERDEDGRAEDEVRLAEMILRDEEVQGGSRV